MKKHFKELFSAALLLTFVQGLMADSIDSLETVLRSQAPQEKIYLHTDNSCYFAGDTLWYKAYLLRSDNLRPSPLSRILYVELLTPDGYLVERQRIVVEHNTQSHGQFFLPDTIYSGYYELRAYTRWQLNFNVESQKHGKLDDERFFSPRLAADYFRDYPDLYSRVLPIFEKPKEKGDYAVKLISERPKRRLAKESDQISVKFYPEGGQLVDALPGQVAFEVLDAHGAPLNIDGTLSDGTVLHPIADGRGIFQHTPTPGKTLKATFSHQGRNYTFPLPEALTHGANIHYDALRQQAEVCTQGVEVAAVAVSCRGQLVQFLRKPELILTSQLPSGVNEIIAYDAAGNPLAVRQLFVNHSDRGQKVQYRLLTSDQGETVESISAGAYQHVQLEAQVDDKKVYCLSVAVRDQRTDDPSFDDGNILTDLLLAGDLRGFVAHPAYYFEKDDDEHRLRLDLLLMIQGWRKYAPVPKMRYLPEQAFVFQGQVHKLSNSESREFDLMDFIHNNQNIDSSDPCFSITPGGQLSLLGDNSSLPETVGIVDEGPAEFAGDTSESGSETEEEPVIEETTEVLQNERISHKKEKVKDKVMVEAELVKDNEIAGVEVLVDSMGRFDFNLPVFYDQAYMFMTAYKEKDSTRYCLASTSDKEKMNPYACPNYYLRREMFFPIFSRPYSWYQTHSPQDPSELEEEQAIDSLLNAHILQNVSVDTHRRRKLRSFDKSKPAMALDFNQLLNATTDYGLHRGGYNGVLFWDEAARYLFGNMGFPNQHFGVRARVDGHIFFKSYKIPQGEVNGLPMTPAVLQKRIDPRHIWKVMVYTDFDIRNQVGREENRAVPDVEFELIPIPGEGKRTMRRDRRFVIDGFSYAEEFYQPDYSNAVPEVPSDYRRTLYWNPNARLDAEGRLQVSFYNNARPTRFSVSICGVGMNGKIFY